MERGKEKKREKKHTNKIKQRNRSEENKNQAYKRKDGLITAI